MSINDSSQALASLVMKSLALHTRLTVWLGALLAAVAVILVVSIARICERYRAETTQRVNAGVAMYVSSELALIDAKGVNRAALDELARRAMTVNPSVEIYLLSPNGEIMATRVDATRLHRQRIDLRPVRQFLKGDYHGPLYGDDPTTADAHNVFTVAEIRTRDELVGYLYAVLGGEKYTSVAAAVRKNYSLQIALLVVAALLVLAVAAGAMLFHRLTLPLRQLNARMQSWSRHMGIAGMHAKGLAMDEIAALAAQFDLLSNRIAAQVDEIAARDRQRRELIASVSHDLRTPLAALHGYLEAVLLKDDGMDKPLRHQYLSIAHRHATQLGRLIAALFDLSKLEAGLITLNPQSFSLAELLCDVALRFQLRAEQAQVRLEAKVDPGDPPVYADIALVERALANLIDNALRHTNPGGMIRLSSSRTGALMRVMVEDTGSGMTCPVDRPYAGAGLGLSIVKCIVQLHGDELDIDSAPQHGTKMKFHLPLTARDADATRPVSSVATMDHTESARVTRPQAGAASAHSAG